MSPTEGSLASAATSGIRTLFLPIGAYVGPPEVPSDGDRSTLGWGSGMGIGTIHKMRLWTLEIMAKKQP